MINRYTNEGETVICRIGSLEKWAQLFALVKKVICRIGSLENVTLHLLLRTIVICRIGSLENQGR